MRRIIVTLLCTASLLGIAADAPAQSSGAVINQAGINVKLITTKSTRLYSSPSTGNNSAPCSMFSFWYVLPPHMGVSCAWDVAVHGCLFHSAYTPPSR